MYAWTDAQVAGGGPGWNWTTDRVTMTHIIAVSNRKGGVGKTTTCFSLGACLAEMGLRTLVVDLDSQGDLTLAAGWDAEGGEREP